MSPLYLCGKPCSTGTQNETVKRLTLFSAFIRRIMIVITAPNLKSRSLISNPAWNLECRSNVISFSSRIDSSIIFAMTIVIHAYRNLIGNLGSSEFGPKQSQVFHRNIMSLCRPTRFIKGLQVISLVDIPEMFPMHKQSHHPKEQQYDYHHLMFGQFSQMTQV